VNTFRGSLLHIHVAPGAAAPMAELADAELIAGLGIAADRYATRTGTYSARHHIDRQITLIETEALDALARDHGVELAAHEHRRNLTTAGVPLGHLVGRYFLVGDAVLYGGRLNVPCNHLQELAGKRVFRPLVHRSGLNARVLVGTTIRPGDAIVPIDPLRLPAELVAANERDPASPAPEVF